MIDASCVRGRGVDDLAVLQQLDCHAGHRPRHIPGTWSIKAPPVDWCIVVIGAVALFLNVAVEEEHVRLQVRDVRVPLDDLGQRRVIELVHQAGRVGVLVEEAVAVAKRLELPGQDRLLGLAQRRAGQMVLAHQADKRLHVIDAAVDLPKFLLKLDIGRDLGE